MPPHATPSHRDQGNGQGLGKAPECLSEALACDYSPLGLLDGWIFALGVLRATGCKPGGHLGGVPVGPTRPPILKPAGILPLLLQRLIVSTETPSNSAT